MNFMNTKVNLLIIIFLAIKNVGVSSKDLDETERSERALFVQRLLNKNKHLEGRIRLIGGRDKFEGE